MYKKSPQGWLKHWDFILLDIFCLQLAFVVAYLVRQGLENPYSDQIYRTVAFVFMLCQIVVMFLGQSYQDILKRGYYIEFTKTAKHVLMVMLLSVLYLFATQQAVSYSRLTLFYTAFLYLCFDYVGRVWHKENVLKKNATKKKEKSMVVVVSLAEAKETIEKILSGPIQNFSINGLALIDDNPGVKEIAGIPVVGNMDTISEYLCHEWVDEVFVKISETEPYPQKLIDEIITMGLTVHLSLGEMEKSLSGKNFIEKIGGYSVITSSINTASPKQLLYKRLMDIAGGIVGCLLTVILIIVIGPMIYIKSPGPIFFSQVRIGKNGKKFKIYKFRSMYMDAEERKAELMSQNKMEGLMFKMDYDPRIIGSEKKDKNGNPKGIGNFIRKTSLDEFPQFWNVLKGDMSLVGTRPPTVDEWEKQPLHYEGKIDYAYFDYKLGTLEYRSVRFETETLDKPNFQGNAAVNYTDRETPWTRIIEHKWFEFGKDEDGNELPKTVISREFSSEWKTGDEPYYPVNDEKNGALYAEYKKLAGAEEKVIFGGRLGEYKYYDMDAVIASALDMCEKELQ